MSGRVILKNPGIDINQYLKWAGNPPIDIFIRQSNYFASENSVCYSLPESGSRWCRI